MCSHYQGIKERERYLRHFGVAPPGDLGKVDRWPGYLGSFIRRQPHADVGDEAVSPREALSGLFGLVPHWSLDTASTRHTFNARSETVAAKPGFREAWKRTQHYIIPAHAFFEPDWRSGKAIPARIERVDGAPIGLAGLWSWWKSPYGEVVHSYTMLTIRAEDHALMRQFHKLTDEKRMVVILPDDQYDNWLNASPEHSYSFLRQYPVPPLQATHVSAVRLARPQ